MQTHHLKTWLKQQKNLRRGRAWLRHHPEPDLVAARIMFELNRHARSIFGRSPLKRTIYRLKNLLVHHFYQAGHGRRLTMSCQELQCWSCAGTGVYWTGAECYKCDGSGIYNRTELYQFKFQIAGRTFIWHQPHRLVWWDVELTEAGVGEYESGGREWSTLRPDLKPLYIYTLYAYLRDRGAPAYEPPVAVEDPDFGVLWTDETHTLPKLKSFREALRGDLKFAIGWRVAQIKDWYWLRKRNIKRLIEFINTGQIVPEYEITEDEIPF